MTSPTPIDGLVWSYHQLGWSTRRIAGEVQTSQATVVRILERLKKDPPPGETMVMNSTPPGGLSQVRAFPPSWAEEDEPAVRRRPRGNLILTVINLVLMGVLAATLAAAAGGLIARGQAGARGPAGPAGPPGPKRVFTLCVHNSQFTGAIVSLTAPDGKGSCGSGTMIKLPG